MAEPWGSCGKCPTRDERREAMELFHREVRLAGSAYAGDSKRRAQWKRWRAVCKELLPCCGEYCSGASTSQVFALLLRQGYTPDQLRAMFALAFT